MDAAAVGGWLANVGLGGLTAQFADAVRAANRARRPMATLAWLAHLWLWLWL